MAKTTKEQSADRPARPSFDEYFMNIAKTTSTRSSCIRRQVGAIIVKDRRLISTGYNGTPRGINNCDEGGALAATVPRRAALTSTNACAPMPRRTR